MMEYPFIISIQLTFRVQNLFMNFAEVLGIMWIGEDVTQTSVFFICVLYVE